MWNLDIGISKTMIALKIIGFSLVGSQFTNPRVNYEVGLDSELCTVREMSETSIKVILLPHNLTTSACHCDIILHNPIIYFVYDNNNFCKIHA